MRNLESRALVASVALLALASLDTACTSATRVGAPVGEAPEVLRPVEGYRTWVSVPQRAYLPLHSKRGFNFAGCALPIYRTFEPDEELVIPPLPGETVELGEWQPLEPSWPVDCPQTTLVRVVDARDGRELDQITVADGALLGGVFGASGIARGDECLVRDAANPVDIRDLYLEGPQHRMRSVVVRAKGYAAERVELDLLRGGLQTVALRPEVPLRVVLRGVDPSGFARQNLCISRFGWGEFSQPIDRDGWLDVEGLRAGEVRVALDSWEKDRHVVHSSAAVELREGLPARVVLDVKDCVPVVRVFKQEKPNWSLLLEQLQCERPPRLAASLHPRCGNLVLAVPDVFEVPPESGLEFDGLEPDQFVVVAKCPGQYEIATPRIPGFRAPERVLVTTEAGRDLDYVIEYERVER